MTCNGMKPRRNICWMD